MILNNSKRLIIKIGSALLVDEARSRVNHDWLSSVIEDIVNLKKQGIQIVIVSSGAMALGKIALNLSHKQLSLEKKQACAATGQIQLMHIFQELLNKHGIQAAQVLITLDDSEHRRRFLNARNTLEALLNMNVIPIINENDTVATAEIRYGDNDRLAARVAQMVDADTLILLSDIDGFYTADPNLNPEAKFIPAIEELTEEILNMGGESSSHYGSGGMVTKLMAAKIAMQSGCGMLLTTGKPKHPIKTFLETNRGTWFIAKTSPLSAKKAWLSEHLKPKGQIIIDDGAAKALQNGMSLLPVGIKDIVGRFQKGDAVQVTTMEHKPIACGLSNYSFDDIQLIKGKASGIIPKILGYEGCDEVVHRDNLVLL